MSMKKTLVILAAGLGSRFGGCIKQLEPIGPNGELIIDYSIHDAIEAGFERIVFVIRHDIEADFRKRIGRRIERVCQTLGIDVLYAYQELYDVPGTFPEGRKKPWGTGHAVLACDKLISEPFAVINSDDYYGKDGFRKASLFLESDGYALIGYHLNRTLSDNGGVTRGICKISEGKLAEIKETRNIVKSEAVAKSGNSILPVDSVVSMNFWCFPASFIMVLKRGFPIFIDDMTDKMEEEYLLPNIVDSLVKKGTEVSVIITEDKWFGMTYREDLETVRTEMKRLYCDRVYHTDLYSDLQ